MSSLYIDRRGVELTLDSDALAFHENGRRIGTVPLAPLERIYMRGDVRVSSGLLGRLGAHGIGLIILSGRRAEPTLFLPRPHNDACLRVAQIRCTLDERTRLGIARWLVRAKIIAHQTLLAEIAEARPAVRYPLATAAQTHGRMLGQLDEKPDLAALRGLEGAAAACYFGAIPSIFPQELRFTGRNRRPPRDPVNAILSLGYTMLQAEASLAAYGHGFDPFVGFLHDLDFGRPSLGCDLAEPLRPVIDRFTWRLFAEQGLRARDFSTEKDGACLLGKAGRERFYGEIEPALATIRKQVDLLLAALKDKILKVNDAETLPDQL